MILDSCFLIDVMTKDDGAIAKREEILQSGVPTVVAAPSSTEVERGLDTERRQRRFRSLMTDLSVVAYDHEIARRAADILRTLDDRGEPIGTLDAMVAATAASRDEPVVTRNLSEFDRVEGLTVSPY